MSSNTAATKLSDINRKTSMQKHYRNASGDKVA